MELNHDLLLEHLCRHLVGIMWVDQKKGQPETARSMAVTSFVVSIGDAWFLVTAGHVLRDIERHFAAGHEIINSRLVELSKLKPKQEFAIPFILDDESLALTAYDEDKGIDYGIIPLRHLFVVQLKAGGVEPLSEATWADPPDIKSAKLAFLLGFPVSEQKGQVTNLGTKFRADHQISTPLMPVIPVDDPPAVLKKHFDRIYGRVPIVNDSEGGTFDDIVGMSGGPLFVFDGEEGNLRYWVLGVQSGWHAKSRTIAACPLKPFLEFIIKMAEKNGDA